MLERSAAYPHVSFLCNGQIQLRLGLRYIFVGSDSALESGVCQIKVLPVIGDRVSQDLPLSVESSDFEIVLGQFRLRAEDGGSEIGSTSLCFKRVFGYRVSNAMPEVYLIREGGREGEIVQNPSV